MLLFNCQPHQAAAQAAVRGENGWVARSLHTAGAAAGGCGPQQRHAHGRLLGQTPRPCASRAQHPHRSATQGTPAQSIPPPPPISPPPADLPGPASGPPVQVTDLTNVPYIAREMMLIKVRCTAQQRGELMNLAQVRKGWGCAHGGAQRHEAVVGCRWGGLRGMCSSLRPAQRGSCSARLAGAALGDGWWGEWCGMAVICLALAAGAHALHCHPGHVGRAGRRACMPHPTPPITHTHMPRAISLLATLHAPTPPSLQPLPALPMWPSPTLFPSVPPPPRPSPHLFVRSSTATWWTCARTR